MAIGSQQTFVRATTVQLLCREQNYKVITMLQSTWEQNEIFIKFELRWEKHKKKMGPWVYMDGLVQERRNSIANALELHLSCINP